MTDNTITITPSESKRIALICQGLYARAPFGRGVKGLIQTVQQLGYVQIDTISVVARAHHHVLLSRLPQYKPSQLIDAQTRHRAILEYWAHAAAYIPIEDFRFTIPTQEYFRSGNDGWPQCDQQVADFVLRRITEEGPLKSRDFKYPEGFKHTGWWEWKPSKQALQRLFLEGRLAISHREGFQRVFDLPERVIPASINTTTPSKKEYYDYLIDTFLRANGFGSARMFTHLRKGMSAKVTKRISERLHQGSLVKLNIKDKDHRALFASPDVMSHLQKSVRRQVRIISPFDNLVIQRERLKVIFDFDYQIECYVPKEKRIHGYYAMPILLGTKFIGRMDAKADRKSGSFMIHAVTIESGTSSDTFGAQFVEALSEYAAFCGCTHLTFSNNVPSAIRSHHKNP